MKDEAGVAEASWAGMTWERKWFQKSTVLAEACSKKVY